MPAGINPPTPVELLEERASEPLISLLGLLPQPTKTRARATKAANHLPIPTLASRRETRLITCPANSYALLVDRAIHRSQSAVGPGHQKVVYPAPPFLPPSLSSLLPTCMNTSGCDLHTACTVNEDDLLWEQHRKEGSPKDAQ